jgi:hypothetical protein
MLCPEKLISLRDRVRRMRIAMKWMVELDGTQEDRLDSARRTGDWIEDHKMEFVECRTWMAAACEGRLSHKRQTTFRTQNRPKYKERARLLPSLG